MISGALGVPYTNSSTRTLTLTGKRKEQDKEQEQGEEEDFADSQQIIMETEYHEATYTSENNGIEGRNDQTNSSTEGMTGHMQVK
jgi:hypothetical protein